MTWRALCISPWVAAGVAALNVSPNGSGKTARRSMTLNDFGRTVTLREALQMAGLNKRRPEHRGSLGIFRWTTWKPSVACFLSMLCHFSYRSSLSVPLS